MIVLREMFLDEIGFPETKPETEWVRGRALQKVSPTYWHGLVERRIATAVGEWAEAGDRGRVATEWRFRITPPGERTRPLVPDVAFVSYSKLPKDAPNDKVGIPKLAPTAAFEILSPDDRRDDVDDKIATYIAAGTEVVIVIDPMLRSAEIHDGNEVRLVATDDRISHPALPRLSIGLKEIFA